jgi:hypothetical protein
MAKKLLTIDDELLGKVKLLSWRRKTFQQDIIIAAIEYYIESFENQAESTRKETEDTF